MGRLSTFLSRGHKQLKVWEEEMDGNCLREGSPGSARSFLLPLTASCRRSQLKWTVLSTTSIWPRSGMSRQNRRLEESVELFNGLKPAARLTQHIASPFPSLKTSKIER